MTLVDVWSSYWFLDDHVAIWWLSENITYARPFLGMPDQNLTSFATSNNHLKLKYEYRHFQNNIVCYCNVYTNEVMGIWNEKITISLKNWHFLTYFTKQDIITPGQVLANAEVLCFIMIPFQQDLAAFLSDYISAKVIISIYKMLTLCASLILNEIPHDIKFNTYPYWLLFDVL